MLISEIFYSIQGEGELTGVLSRLSFLGIFLVEMYTSAIKKHLEEGFTPEDVIALVDLDIEMTAEGHFLEKGP
jgi:hypothetical protein